MPLMIFVGIASSGALFMIFFIAALNRDEQRRKSERTGGFVSLMNAVGIRAGSKTWPVCVVKVAQCSSGQRQSRPVLTLTPRQTASANPGLVRPAGARSYARGRSLSVNARRG